jgi:hypothetical protein
MDSWFAKIPFFDMESKRATIKKKRRGFLGESTLLLPFHSRYCDGKYSWKVMQSKVVDHLDERKKKKYTWTRKDDSFSIL